VKLNISPNLCKGCGICVEFCLKHVLKLDERGHVFADQGKKCIYCGLCELRCPDFAIEVDKENRG
jgi:2-oxoglutarate ferredoxin oxidoreductase subunit delta